MTARCFVELANKRLKQRRAFLSVVIGSACRPLVRTSPDVDCYIVFTWQKEKQCLGRLTVSECGTTKEALMHAAWRTHGSVYINSIVLQASLGYRIWRIFAQVPAECKELCDWLKAVTVDHLYLKTSEFTPERLEVLESLIQESVKSICDYRG